MQQCALLVDGGAQADTVMHKTTTWRERLRGLLWHTPLTDKQGLWLEPCSSIHTVLMTYSIDVVFLDKQGVIIAIRHSVKPWRMAFCIGARSAVEFAAGVAAQQQLHVGQRLQCGTVLGDGQ